MFLLDPEVAYLNHGSFGACPRPVFDVYQEWQRVLEREPIDLLERRLKDELARVRATLGDNVGAPAGDLALLPNATSALEHRPAVPPTPGARERESHGSTFYVDSRGLDVKIRP
jgi:hypothetical protein